MRKFKKPQSEYKRQTLPHFQELQNTANPLSPITYNPKTGLPVAAHSNANATKDQVEGMVFAAWSALYEGDRDPETGNITGFNPKFAGLTYGEVANLRMAEKAAMGDTQAYTAMMDRMLGKPKQQTETVSMTMTYQDFLDQLDSETDEDDPSHSQHQTVDVTAHHPQDPQDPFNLTDGI